MIDVLIEKNIAFVNLAPTLGLFESITTPYSSAVLQVMSHGSSMASPMPDDVKTRIEAYGNAIVSDWVPQQALLGHLVSDLLEELWIPQPIVCSPAMYMTGDRMVSHARWTQR